MNGTSLYTEGSADFSSGSAAVRGHGTVWTSLVEGDVLIGPDGRFYEIASIEGDENFTVSPAYKGDSVSGASYTIIKASAARDSVRQATKQLSTISSLYRAMINATSVDTTLVLNKETTDDRAGLVFKKNGLEALQVGSFEDDDFAIRYLLSSTWSKAFSVNSATGAVSILSQFLLGAAVTPPVLTGNVSDFAPRGLAQANVLRLNGGSASRHLTGIAGGVAGRVLAVVNTGSYGIVLDSESLSSAEPNRFGIPSDTTLPGKSVGILLYDGSGAAGRWRLIAGGGSATGEKGWSPALAFVADGDRTVVQITSWIGGQGEPPAPGLYLGAEGQVENIADAIDIRGLIGPRQIATSTTELVTSAGAKVFETQTLLPFSDGARLRATSASNHLRWMEGTATYSGSTLTLDVDAYGPDTGAAADWNINFAGEKGDKGDAATIEIGSVVTGPAGSAVSVTNIGDAHNAILNLVIPRGDKGEVGATYKGTSETNLVIGTGQKVFTTQSGLAYANGARVRASSNADPSKWMEGVVTYSGTTLTMNCDLANGTGAASDWNINLTGERGPTGVGIAGPAPWSQPVPWAPDLVCVATAPATAVVYAGETYVCTTPHTTTSIFDPLKFIKITVKGVDGNGSGDVVGDDASTIGNFATFASTDGKRIKDSGVSVSSLGDLAFKNEYQLADPVAMAIVFGA